jgi:hypothetical protein
MLQLLLLHFVKRAETIFGWNKALSTSFKFLLFYFRSELLFRMFVVIMWSLGLLRSCGR